MTKQVSTGKYRALQRASNDNRTFNILAIDHLDSLRKLLKPESPDTVTDHDMAVIKNQVISTQWDQISGVLLDPVYGAAQSVASGLPGHVGLLVELEKADYNLAPLPLAVEIRPNWSVDAIKRMGADGVKLFYYDDCDDIALCDQQDQTLKQVVVDCNRYDIPLYAEPIVLNATPTTRSDKVLRSAIRADMLGADVLKLEFPVDTKADPDRNSWYSACSLITQSVTAPWVLLSAGVDFETFALQLDVACQAGASGYIVGRAVWGEACAIADFDERINWLQAVARERISTLNAIVETSANPWTMRLEHAPITPDWHVSYPTIFEA